MKKDSHLEEILFLGILIIPVIWIALLIAPYIHEGLFNAMTNINNALDNPFSITWCQDSLRTVMIFLLGYLMGIGIYLSSLKNYRRKEEYGSARWGNTHKINKKYASKDYCDNKILSQNVRIGLDGKKHRRNLNTIVIGGSGAGKTRFYGKPNIMQCNTSFVTLDPKGGAIRSRMKSTCAQLNK